ncbi:MAG: hypothetical protein II708_01760, partial [Paludibacteraceae bacterium]|nr:hypothetical protein [Paludibacteraceae bacterium]
FSLTQRARRNKSGNLVMGSKMATFASCGVRFPSRSQHSEVFGNPARRHPILRVPKLSHARVWRLDRRCAH